MPRLLDYISPAYAWLQAIDPSLPRALFVALVFASVLAWRKLSPSTWIKFSGLIKVTDEDASWFKSTMLKLWQAVPAATIGAVYGALGTGGNVAASLKLALLGLLAPVIHELAWRYQGNLGSAKNPPPSDPKPLAQVERISFVKPDDEPAPPSLPGAAILLLVAGFALHQQACSSVAPPVAKSLPCDDAKMTRIDLAYVAEVAAQCREYPSKHECPAWPSLRAKHRAALRNECPQ